jgi:hypothetical protein
MKDANYEYETRRRHGRVREHYIDVCEALHKMPHTQKVASNVNHLQAAHVSVMRSMAQDKVAAAGKGIMNDKRFNVGSRTKTNTRKESVSDLVLLRSGEIYLDEYAQALAPLAGAGLRAVGGAIAKKASQVTVKSAAKSAGKFAASEIGSRAASKIMSRKESIDENLLNRFSNSAYRKQAKETARVQKKVGDPKNYLRLKKKGVVEGWGSVAAGALKSGTAKGLYKTAATGAAQQVGAGFGAKIGRRVATGSNRQQMKRAKFQRKLDRKAGGHFREGVIEGILGHAEMVKDFHMKPTIGLAKGVTNVVTKPLQKATGKQFKAGEWWQMPKLESSLEEKLSGKTGLKLGGKIMGIASGGGFGFNKMVHNLP